MALDTTSPSIERLAASLAEIVAIDTQNPPGREAEAAAWVRARLDGLGFEAGTVDIAPGRTNVVATFANGPGPTFAFNTHLDVVPAGDGWTGDPFVLRRDGARLYGRGACDAKGPLVSMLAAMEQLVAARHHWSGTLMGIFVADEEVASAGARSYVADAAAIDFCVVGEPTSCTVVSAHKGSMRPIVHVQGRTAHSGTPDLGINAVLESGALFEEVAAEHRRIAGRSHDLVGHPSLTVTRIAGGHADNVVPELCELLLDRRMIPGEDEDEVRREIAALVARASEAGRARMTVAGYKPTTGGATQTEGSHPVVVAAQEACARHHGRRTPLTGFQGGCDLVHFRQLGAAGIVLGPGDLAVAHKPDEFVPEAELLLAADIYRDTALRLLSA